MQTLNAGKTKLAFKNGVNLLTLAFLYTNEPLS